MCHLSLSIRLRSQFVYVHRYRMRRLPKHFAKSQLVRVNGAGHRFQPAIRLASGRACRPPLPARHPDRSPDARARVAPAETGSPHTIRVARLAPTCCSAATRLHSRLGAACCGPRASPSRVPPASEPLPQPGATRSASLPARAARTRPVSEPARASAHIKGRDGGAGGARVLTAFTLTSFRGACALVTPDIRLCRPILPRPRWRVAA